MTEDYAKKHFAEKRLAEDTDFLNSTRGKYIVAQALHVAIDALSREKESNLVSIGDMQRILDSEHFKMYSVVFETLKEEKEAYRKKHGKIVDRYQMDLAEKAKEKV
jgi:hypothetical protein